MNNLSGALVTYNEEKYIRKCLESMKAVCDEIVVFDSFSTDNTTKIAEEFGCKIFQNEFDNHRDQKNRAIEKCTKEWVLLLDADEYLDKKLIGNMDNLINNKDGIDAFGLPRKNYYINDNGEIEDGPVAYPDIQTRLFKNYVRHYGHPFHHMTNGNAKKHVLVYDQGNIIHSKTWKRQERQNRLYYYFRPQDYKEKPRGAEDIKIDINVIKNPNDVNVYKNFTLKNMNNE